MAPGYTLNDFTRLEQDMKIDLSGKIAVVTGAAGDLGRAIARVLGACGADVAVHYNTNKATAEKIAQEIRAMGRRAVTVQADVGDQASVQAMHAAVVRQLGDAYIVVTNAVAQYRWTTVMEQGVADYESQFRTCVLQNVLMAKAFVPGMIAKGGGRIIAMNTECAMQCFPSQSAYVSGKRGMDGVLRVLAREVGPHGITVNQVAPGWTISDRDRAAGTERQPDHEKNIPLRHRGEDTDIANAVAFLASGLARYISGVYLPVAGGNVMPTI
jgi:3-oxoacyl-[acyl-carrier protein] reductase